MLRNLKFTIQEGLSLLNKNRGKTIYYIGVLILNQLFAILFFITCININYIWEVSPAGSLPYTLYPLLEPHWAGVDGLRVILFFILLIIGSFLILLNRRYIDFYIKSYSAEIKLVGKLGGNWSYIRWPIFLISFVLNGLALFISYLIGKGVYAFFYNSLHIIGGNQLVKFELFDTSLFIFLLIVISGIVLVTDFYLFFKYKIK